MTLLEILLNESKGDGGTWITSPQVNHDPPKTKCCTNHRVDIMVNGQNINGQTQNVSASSLGIFCRRPIEIGKIVAVGLVFEQCPLMNMKVVHCTQSLGGFKIGLEAI